jgi:hypothetical protein
MFEIISQETIALSTSHLYGVDRWGEQTPTGESCAAPPCHERKLGYMSTSLKKRVAYLVMGTVTVAGMTGAFGTAAFAGEGDTKVPTSGAAFDGYARTLLGSDDVEAVATDGHGNVVVYTTTAVDQIDDAKAQELVESTSNKIVKVLDAPLESYDADDVVGGAGYVSNPDAQGYVGLCSIGFTGWTPQGAPAFLSAGHCTDDGAITASNLTLPTGDPGGGGNVDNSDIQPTQPLGTLGFAQFGGPGNTAGQVGNFNSIDISAWNVTNGGLTLHPAVTDWTTAASEDLAASSFPVKSVGEAVVGAAISKSGRTTGFTSGTVESVKGWANVEGRQVYGFMTVLKAAPGDSGGSMTQGSTAVGVLSGGSTNAAGITHTWGADLKAGLALTGGYSVALQLDTPTVTSGAQVVSGTPITGTGNPGSDLTVTPSTGASFVVKVDANGVWSFPAGKPGAYNYSIYTQRGFDTSATTTFAVVVTPAPLPTPVITSVTPGQSVATSVTSISGTGAAGATLTLSGAVTGTALVAADGTWSVKANLGYGSYTVTAVQTRADSAASQPAAVSFTVVPVAPVITSPASGTSYAYGSGPTTITGTGIDGAQIGLSINGTVVRTAVVANGAWSITLDSQLPVGTITVSAAQTIGGVTGFASASTITITPAVAGVTPTKPAAPAGNGKGVLASTGADVAPVLGGALGLLLAGMMLFVVRRTGIARRK